jgi:hypothetical protein
MDKWFVTLSNKEYKDITRATSSPRCQEFSKEYNKTEWKKRMIKAMMENKPIFVQCDYWYRYDILIWHFDGELEKITFQYFHPKIIIVISDVECYLVLSVFFDPLEKILCNHLYRDSLVLYMWKEENIQIKYI